MKVVVVGNFELSEMKSYVEKYFGEVENHFEGLFARIETNELMVLKLK